MSCYANADVIFSEEEIVFSPVQRSGLIYDLADVIGSCGFHWVVRIQIQAVGLLTQSPLCGDLDLRLSDRPQHDSHPDDFSLTSGRKRN